jgi:hypothetical protein
MLFVLEQHIERALKFQHDRLDTLISTGDIRPMRSSSGEAARRRVSLRIGDNA